MKWVQGEGVHCLSLDAGSSHYENPVIYKTTNSEQPLDTSPPVVSCLPQFQAAAPKPFGASKDQVKNKMDGTLHHPNNKPEKEETREELLVKLMEQLSENENITTYIQEKRKGENI